MEIARLTCLPEIREIWISGNPFVKTYSGNRVVIFNLFRRTPGYSVDIIIDGTGPGYTERKQLVERVAEPEGAPVIRTPVADHSAVVSKSPSTAVAQQAPVPVARPGQASEEVRGNACGVGPPRRRRANRRRIVDVPKDHKERPPKDGKSDSGTTVTPVLSTIQHVQIPNEPRFAAVSDRQWKSDGGSQGGSHQFQSNHERPGDAGTMAQTPRHGADWNMDGDLYIRQLEALRQEVWLNALSDHTKSREVSVPHTGTPLDESTRIPADTIPRACSNQIIIGGDRT